MKKKNLAIAFCFLLAACHSDKNIPDVSGVKVEMKLQRFDRDFFSIDSLQLDASLKSLQHNYPRFLPIFLNNVLSLDSASLYPGITQFLRLTRPINDSVQVVFKNTDDLKEQVRNAFRFVLYYFPQYQVPNIITVTGPINAMAQTATGYSPDFLGPDFLGISLQFYLGKDFALYKDQFFIDNVAPLYRTRRFSKEYIAADAMQLVVDDLFPDNSKGKPFIEQMIEKGKQWYLLDQFMPEAPDSIKTGYTQSQLDWCNDNEGLIWSYIVKNENLNTIDPATIQIYVGEAPFTQGFSQELSPGNIGQWLGWRIVKKWVDKNAGLKPAEVMKTDARKIFEEAKYKPK